MVHLLHRLYGVDAHSSICVRNNNNNNSHDNVYGAIIMTEIIARVQPVQLMNVD